MPGDPRKVQFDLYTDKDYSNDTHNITFTLFMNKTTGETLWDSVLAPMEIKDIPDPAHKLIIERAVPGNDTSLLKVGFLYTIEGVGSSWYIDSSNSGETFKIVDYNFQ